MAKWLWPCPGNTRITSGVGPRWGTTHKGIDIAAPRGSNIVASRSGVIKAVNTNCPDDFPKNYSCGHGGGYGNYVDIDHLDGYMSRYAHMSTVSVKVGDRVHQGKVIGTVGSTGYSTGNHLHFEIRDKSNNPKDPEKYVNPSNTIPDSEYSGNLTDRGYPSSTSGDVASKYNSNKSGTAAAVESYIEGLDSVMTKDFIEGHPYHAYLKIIVGDRELVYSHGKPSIIQSFEINRLEDAGCTSNFTLFDDNFNDLEVYLAKNYMNIRIQYGYSEGIMSPEYKMILQDYEISFKNTGTILSIKAISEGIYQNLDPVKFPTYTNNPSEAIRVICNHMGWDIDEDDFVETKSIEGRDNYDLVNVNPIKYINEVILPDAMTNDDLEETVVFYLDATKNGKAHLKAKTYGESSNVEANSVPTYVYMKGYDSVVEDLSIHLKGVFGGTSQFRTVTGLVGRVISDDKSETTNKVDQNTAISKSTGTGDSSHTLDQSTVNFPSAGETEGQVIARMNYMIKYGTNQAYEATMVMLGDPRIEILQYIRLLIFTDRDCELHHTSGIYIVTGISDSIENGNFRTTLILRRNGDTQGIIIREPKYKRD